MGGKDLADESVREVADDLRTRYSLDEEDVRLLGARLAGALDGHSTQKNTAFAERFVDEHRATFDRLAQ